MANPHIHIRWAIALCIGTAGLAQAQIPPDYKPPVMDAGALARQVDQSVMDGMSQRKRLSTSALPPALTMTDATRVSVQRFEFHGNKLLTTEQLQQVAAPFTHRTLSQPDLQQLTHAVSEAYRQIGWLVQAYIPRQSLTEDVLILQVIESFPPNKP
jgi:hemolysin activation/secretion protein